MNKVAFLFPGQGAQYVGMGFDFYKNNEEARKIFEKANNSLGYDITKLCFEGPEEELIKTENTQPAILTTSIAIQKATEQLGIKADVTAGLSLGEYSSLVYAGVLSFEEAVKVVKKRGKYMQEAVPLGKGTMAAIVGLNEDELKEVLNEAQIEGIVEGANYNCPQQIVIAGEVKAVEMACKLSAEKGAKKTVLLPVSAPFHSSMLKPAGDKLRVELEKIKFNDLSTKVISNVTAQYIDKKEEVLDLLTKQVYSPVLWQQTIELMINDGIDTFIEFGPGKTLTSFIKKTAKKMGTKVQCLNINCYEDLEKIK